MELSEFVLNWDNMIEGDGEEPMDLEEDEDSDAGAGSGYLDFGTKVELAIYPMRRTVVFPGESVPLILPTERAEILISSILNAPKPFTRLFGMVHFDLNSEVGCTVELIQRGEDSDESGGTSILVKALQRFKYSFDADLPRATTSPGGGGGVDRGHAFHIDQAGLLRHEVEILEDEPYPCQIPRPVRSDSTFWGSWAYRRFDVKLLSTKAMVLYRQLVPDHKVQDIHDPIQFSFWVASALPLDAQKQQHLLECESASERLLEQIRIMEKMLGSRMKCICMVDIALSSDIFRMENSEGISAIFVNSHGFLHDIVTLLKVRKAKLQGSPETAHCWFPGYAWQIANCKECGNHLGWKFTSVAQGLRPKSFWGLRRDALALPEDHSDL